MHGKYMDCCTPRVQVHSSPVGTHAGVAPIRGSGKYMGRTIWLGSTRFLDDVGRVGVVIEGQAGGMA